VGGTYSDFDDHFALCDFLLGFSLLLSSSLCSLLLSMILPNSSDD